MNVKSLCCLCKLQKKKQSRDAFFISFIMKSIHLNFSEVEIVRENFFYLVHKNNFKTAWIIYKRDWSKIIEPLSVEFSFTKIVNLHYFQYE